MRPPDSCSMARAIASNSASAADPGGLVEPSRSTNSAPADAAPCASTPSHAMAAINDLFENIGGILRRARTQDHPSRAKSRLKIGFVVLRWFGRLRREQ